MHLPVNVRFAFAENPMYRYGIRPQVQDGLEQWRLDLAMPKILETIKDHNNLPRVTEQVLPRPTLLPPGPAIFL